MRTRIIQLLILTLIFGPSSASAERARQRPPKASRKLLKWIVPDWVDVTFGKNSEGESNSTKKAKDISSLLNEINNAGGSANKNKGSGSGIGNGTGSKGNGSGSGQTLVFNDDAKNGEQPKEGVGDRGGPPPGGGDNRPPGDKPIIFDLYWPVCIFLDPSVSDTQANEIVKGTIDKAGACGVNLNVVPITIKGNYPKGSPDAFNQMQQASCNMQSIGVQSASTLLVNPDPEAAAKMCDVKETLPGGGIKWDLGVAGCAQLRGGGGISKEQMTSMQGSSFGGMGGENGIFPSVIVPIGWNSGVASHEAIGHSQMGWPNMGEDPSQIDAGLGIGTPSTKGGASNQLFEKDIYSAMLEEISKPQFSAAEGSFESSGWTGVGCAQLRKRALPNKHRFGWSPKQTVYTVVEKDPQRQWQLGNPLWGSIPPGGPPSNPPPIVKNEPPTPPQEDKSKLTMNDEAPKISSPPPPEDDGRHRKRKGGSGGGGGGGGGGQEIDKLLTNLRKKGDVPEDQMTRGKPIPSKNDGSRGDSLVFDDSARKGGDQPAGDVGGSIASGTDVGGGMSGDGASSGSLTFDESAAKGGASGGSGSGSSSSSGDGGSGPASGGNRKPASLTGDFFEKNLSKNAKAKESSMDDGFFDSIIKAENKQRKRVKGETLRTRMKEKASDARGRPAPKTKQSGR